jgi:hypothetical protein
VLERGEMVDIVGSTLLTDVGRDEKTSRFPPAERDAIYSAVRLVPEDIEHRDPFDGHLSDRLPEYLSEQDDDPGCGLWSEEGFNYTVDLYHPEERIAVEIEKTGRKYLWRDLVKFSRGAVSSPDSEPSVRFGCIITPGVSNNDEKLYNRACRIMAFMEPILPVDDILIVGYDRPTAD